MLAHILTVTPRVHAYIGREDACHLTPTASAYSESFATWLFLQHQHRFGMRCHRAFRAMARQLRRMGLFRLYALLMDRVHAYVVLSTFEKYKERPGHFGLQASIQKFFSASATNTSILYPRHNWAWREARTYIRRLHHAVINRRFYAFHQLCLRAPDHAARRYPMVVANECSDIGGLSVMMHLVHHELWPPSVMEMLLRAIHPQPPALWVPALHTAAAACQQIRLRRAFRRLRRRLTRAAAGGGHTDPGTGPAHTATPL